MDINGKYAARGSSSYGELSNVQQEGGNGRKGEQGQNYSGALRMPDGTKMQWATFYVAANTTTEVLLPETYTEDHYSVTAQFSGGVGVSDTETNCQVWVPNGLRTLTHAEIGHGGEDAKSITVYSIGKDKINEPVLDNRGMDFRGPFGDIETEYLKNSDSHFTGTAGNFSIQLNLRPNNGTGHVLWDANPIAGGISGRYNIQNQANGVGVAADFVFWARSTIGFNTKELEWVDAIEDSGTDHNSFIFTWDEATQIGKLYRYAVDLGDPVVTADTGEVVLENELRHHAIGNSAETDFLQYNGDYHSLSVWDVTLTQDEVTALNNGGNPEGYDNRFPTGAYTQEKALHLQHYWRMGLDPRDVGKDYGFAADLIDLGTHSAFLPDGIVDDIIEYP